MKNCTVTKRLQLAGIDKSLVTVDGKTVTNVTRYKPATYKQFVTVFVTVKRAKVTIVSRYKSMRCEPFVTL